ncbi:peptidase associated/transthyretin-like domain-containing protein [Psychroserpens sp. MEBiC05023]
MTYQPLLELKLHHYVFVLLVPFLSSSQTVKGYIYDAESVVKGAKLLNMSQHVITYTNDHGVFEIAAKLSDTIIVTSYFHTEKQYIISQNDLNSDIVIELKKITNVLDEVLVNKTLEKPLDTLNISKSFSLQLANDIKNRPWLYGEQPSSNIDFIAIGKLIGKLFKKKERTIIAYIKPEDLVQKFEESSLFNIDLLRNELFITEEYQSLFFDYCSAQNLSAQLLSNDNDFILLEALLKHSKAFNKIITDYKKN